MNKKLILRIQELFFHKLCQQTNWGKNQVEIIYKDAVNEALLELVDEQKREIEIMTDMTNSRMLGFKEYYNTTDSFFKLFEQLRSDKIIP